MKTCANCKKEFKTSIKLNGELKSLSSRKYCLECSPWGKHNTKKIGNEIPKSRICPKCVKDLPLDSFYNRRNGTGNSVYCKSCSKDQSLERQRRTKIKAVEYKGGKCEVCSYSKCIAALEFHHKEPHDKDPSFKNFKLRAFDQKFKDELDKCILLCANCHREAHYF